MDQIIFSGCLSDENIKLLSKFDRKRHIILLIIFAFSMVFFSFSISMLTIKQITGLFVIYIIITIITGIILLFGFIICLLYTLVIGFDFPFYKPCYFENQRLIINEWGIESYPIYDPPLKPEFSFYVDNKPFSDHSASYYDIKKVIEKENFYIIIVGSFFKKAFLCQKDLLISGTLKEFEEVFEDKLKRLN